MAEGGGGRRRGVSAVEAGLAPLAPPPPPPPSETEAGLAPTLEETEEGGMIEREDGNEIEGEETESDYEEDEDEGGERETIEIVPQRVRAETMSRAMKAALRREMRTGSMSRAPDSQKNTVAELLHQKDHSRFSILRYSTDTIGTDLDDDEEGFYDDEFSSDREGSDSFVSSPSAADSSTFINQFMYQVAEVEAPTDPDVVYGDESVSPASAGRRGSRARTISVVTSAPRALSVIQREEDNIMKEKASEKRRKDSAKKLDEFLSGAKGESSGAAGGGRHSAATSTTSSSSSRASISKLARSLVAPPAPVTSAGRGGQGGDNGGSKMRERDLSDNQFYHVYAMTRQEFGRLSILKRAWLRQENKHRRPCKGDIEI